ncbi:MAG: hypothetical protein PHE17_15020 [Thiothrix sp.]|uniref:hypothetical protein n=1 Tax=Thiothrix sp. TaxID=1032 RepID=UPI00261C5CC6|nr:hypothetical protein [Thiothrix sp.]MDD5394324.1 hypothetical protein [Thiothrix sp.]
MAGEYKWLAVLAEFEERAGKLSEGIGGAGDGLCAAKAIAVGLAVSDVEAVLGVIRSMLAKYEGVHGSCGEDSQRGCWVCRPLTAFQTPDGEVIQLEEDEAWEKEQRGEGVRMELVEFLQPMGALKAKPKDRKGTGGKDTPAHLSIVGSGDPEEGE